MKKYFIKLPQGKNQVSENIGHFKLKEQTMSLVEPNKFSLSNIIGILSFIATVLTFGATLLGQIDPQYSVWALAIAAALNAFTGRITGTPGK